LRPASLARWSASPAAASVDVHLRACLGRAETDRTVQIRRPLEGDIFQLRTDAPRRSPAPR